MNLEAVINVLHHQKKVVRGWPRLVAACMVVIALHILLLDVA
jgi:hypothetical protein